MVKRDDGSVNILIVDDSEMNRTILSDILVGYDILESVNGIEACNVLQKRSSEIDLVLLDIVMPELSGFDVLEYMNSTGLIQDIPVIMVSSEDSDDNVEWAHRLGATDFISRPFSSVIVCKRVHNVLMQHARQKKLVNIISSQIHQSEQSVNMLIDVLANVVEFRNSDCNSHIHNVRTLTRMLLEELMRQDEARYQFSQSDISYITMASALHDIGKIAIPADILNKPGKLSQAEMAVMKIHSHLGCEILENQVAYKDSRLMRLAMDICRWHHERWDGKGYPDGLSGDDIPIYVQVVSVADVYDALTSKRIYKDAFVHQKALDMILNGECGAFNPVLMDCLKSISDHISEELSKDHMMDTYDEAMRLTSEVFGQENVPISDRTLRLLEHERMKHDVFAVLSNEIQFEFNLRTKDKSQQVNISSYGAKKLGLPETIEYPLLDRRVLNVLAGEDLVRISEMVRSTSPEHPDVNYECEMTVDGKRRWNRITIRALWTTDEVPRYTGAIGKVVDIHDNQMELEKWKTMASYDSLTGLLNHATARARIENRLIERPTAKCAMMVMDLDHFKNANDMHGGHAFGDELLKHFAEKLRNSVRGGDIIARVGGDEFIVFLEYKENDNPFEVVSKVYDRLGGSYKGFDITVSMGVALTESVGTEYNKLFKAADAAAYHSKHEGRSRYSFYDKSMAKMFESNISPVESDKEGEK